MENKVARKDTYEHKNKYGFYEERTQTNYYQYCCLTCGVGESLRREQDRRVEEAAIEQERQRVAAAPSQLPKVIAALLSSGKAPGRVRFTTTPHNRDSRRSGWAQQAEEKRPEIGRFVRWSTKAVGGPAKVAVCEVSAWRIGHELSRSFTRDDTYGTSNWTQLYQLCLTSDGRAIILDRRWEDYNNPKDDDGTVLPRLALVCGPLAKVADSPVLGLTWTAVAILDGITPLL
jgi:hypothetical protein